MPGYACSDPVLTKKKTEFCFYCDAAVRKSGMAPPQTGNSSERRGFLPRRALTRHRQINRAASSQSIAQE
jgi:hypothetical protein